MFSLYNTFLMVQPGLVTVYLIFLIITLLYCKLIQWADYEDDCKWECIRFIAENGPWEPSSRNHSGVSSATISEPGSQETRQERPVLPVAAQVETIPVAAQVETIRPRC